MDIKKYIKSELVTLFEAAKVKSNIDKASSTDASRLSGVFTNLAKRAKSPAAKRKLVTQVIQTLATSLDVTPAEVMRSYRDFKKVSKGNVGTKTKEN
tara:strand:+ start:272 stop:562 length:291 start_codon:yes stop_codon:yes gene_type:complete